MLMGDSLHIGVMSMHCPIPLFSRRIDLNVDFFALVVECKLESFSIDFRKIVECPARDVFDMFLNCLGPADFALYNLVNERVFLILGLFIVDSGTEVSDVSLNQCGASYIDFRLQVLDPLQ
jgi:hypothetical protein